MTQTDTPAPRVMPENPFGEAGRQVEITTPVLSWLLHEQVVAAGTDVHSALKLPVGEGPASPSNPAYLSWIPASLSEDTVRKIIADHDPTPQVADRTTHIGPSGLADDLRSLGERLSQGGALNPEELTSAIALLVKVIPPLS